MGLFEGVLGGLANAAGATGVTDKIAERKKNRKNLSDQELQFETQSVLNDVSALHERKSKLDPKAPNYAQESQQIDKALHDAMGAFKDLYHPDNNPAGLSKLGGFLKSHLGGKKQPATPGEAKQSMQDRIAGIDSVAYAPQAQPDPFTQFKTIAGRDMAPEERTEYAYKQAGIPQPKAQHQSDYAQSLRRFVEAEGGDPDNPTAAQENAFREKRLKDAAAFRATDTTRVTEQTDPFGLKTKTSSTLQRRPAGSSAPVQPNTPPATPREAKERMSKTSPAPASRQLDVQGHIPETAKVNPLLREAANQLIDGKDLDKLGVPMKDREAAAELARSYGWVGQGLFGPKDKLLIRESTGILKQLANSPSLTVLDNTASRLKLGQVLQNPEKRGMIGQAVQGVVAQELSPQEQEFVTLYNQAVGRISGLSQLVRSGRATEAQIERLKTELPNPATTTNSAHAKQKLAQIQNEIDIALEKGQFVEGGPGDTSDDEFLKKF